MQSNNFLEPSLSLLWVLMASYHTASSDNDAKPNLIIKYHDTPKITYKGKPVQGVCSTAMRASDFLYLYAFEETIDLPFLDGIEGGTYTMHREQITVNESMEGLIVQKFKDALNTGFVFKICLQKVTRFLCTFHRLTSFDKGNPLDYVVFIPINRPRKPLLVVFYHLKPNKLIEGETVRVACSAMVGAKGKLMLVLTGTKDRPEQNWAIPFEGEATFQDDSAHPSSLAYQREMTGQGPKITAWLRIPVTKSMRNLWLFCISSNQPGTLQESASTPQPRVISLPFKPKLSVDSSILPRSAAWTIKGYCSSTNPNITELSMAFRTVEQTTVFMEMEDETGMKIYKEKRFPNRHYTGPRSLYSVFFWTETRNNIVRLRMGAVLNASSAAVVVTCRLKNIQVCQHWRPIIVSQGLGREQEEYPSTTPFYLSIVVALVLGLVAGIFLAITVTKCRKLF